MHSTTFRSDHSTIIYNQEILAEVPDSLFDPTNTQTQGAEESLRRGSVRSFVHKGIPLVLKHYERGGKLRTFNRDSYVYLNLQQTRMWREFHLLGHLRELGLPVPVSVAARCERNSILSYRGDLISVRLADARTLLEVLKEAPLSIDTWASIGGVIADFHRNNVFHADLNASNIMLDRKGGIFLIDFDKCSIRPRNKKRWAQANLERLGRSLRKSKRLSEEFHFSEDDIKHLKRGYGAPKSGNRSHHTAQGSNS